MPKVRSNTFVGDDTHPLERPDTHDMVPHGWTLVRSEDIFRDRYMDLLVLVLGLLIGLATPLIRWAALSAKDDLEG